MAASSLGRSCFLAHSRICARTYSRCQRSWRFFPSHSKPYPTAIASTRWFSEEGASEPASGYRYSKSHEWVSVGEDLTRVGISNYAQEKLGDVVFVELPEVGKKLEKGEFLGVLESVKAAEDITTPVGGTVEEVNAALESSPDLVNKDPYNEGWIVKLTDVVPTDLEDLLTVEEYKSHLEDGSV